jgi:hypothetical protein
MARITGVHGIANKYLTRPELVAAWQPALWGGLEEAAAHKVSEPGLEIAFYGGLFRGPDSLPGRASRTGRTTKSRPGGPQAVASQLASVDDEELAYLDQAVSEITTPDDRATAVMPADKALMWLPEPVQKLLGILERRFPFPYGVLFLGVLHEVLWYLRSPDVKAAVDQITAEAADGAAILIGHSLGSVIAYEYLRQSPGHSVRLLLTLGSPLGLRTIRDRLPAGDVAVADWVNVRDRHDPVVAAGALDRWYPAARDARAENGNDAHSATRYLNSKATGRALIDVLPELGQ